MVSEGERRVSALASYVHAHSRSMVPHGLFFSRYFGSLRSQPLCLVLVDPTDGVLEERENPFSHGRVLLSHE
jgi:hypothetical protein